MKTKVSTKQRLNVLDSCDALPIDFSNKELKEIKDLISEEPRSGKRKPIEKIQEVIEEKKEVAEAKEGDEKNPEKVNDEEQSNENADTKKNGKEENQEQKKKENEPIDLRVQSNLQTIIQTHSVAIHGTGNMAIGKTNEENNNNTAQKMKINLQTCS